MDVVIVGRNGEAFRGGVESLMECHVSGLERRSEKPAGACYHADDANAYVWSEAAVTGKRFTCTSVTGRRARPHCCYGSSCHCCCFAGPSR